jgi:hypothetical protein
MSSTSDRIEQLQRRVNEPREQLRIKLNACLSELELGLMRGMVISEFESRLRKLSDEKCARLLSILRE